MVRKESGIVTKSWRFDAFARPWPGDWEQA
jgi:hypothetical protein